MPGFGSLAPGDDWRDQEALAGLALQQEDARKAAAKPQGAMDLLAGPGRIIDSLSKTPTAPVDEATQQYFPEAYENPLVKGLVGGLGAAVASGVTAPGDALAGKIPIHDEEGHISPEMVRRGFDTAALAGGASAAGNLGRDAATAGTDLRVMGNQVLASDSGKPATLIGGARPTTPSDYTRILEAQRATEGYRAAMRDPATGKIYTGSSHQSAIERAPKFDQGADEITNGIWGRLSNEWDKGTENTGFVDRDGKFVSRDEAEKRYGVLTMEDLRDLHKSKTARFRSDTAEPGMAISAADHAPAFYSPTSEALSRIPAKNLTGDMMANQLKRYGAKPEEMDWAGLTDLLASRKGQPITKEEVAQHLENNSPKITPVDRQAMPAWNDLTPNQKNAAAEAYTDRYGEEAHSHRNPNWDGVEEFYDQVKQAGGFGDMLQNKTFGPTTKYDEYQLPGGENYRERLLTLKPGKAPEELDARIREISNWPNDPQSAKNPADQAELSSLNSEWEKRAAAERGYKSSHWDEPNVIVHRRSTDRMLPNENGEPSRSVHAEEIQSDWHQAGAKQGYAKKITELPEGYEVRKTNPGASTYRVYRHDGAPFGGRDAATPEEAIANALPVIEERNHVPDAPFKDSWHRLALHDLIREAAEKGADEISWTAGGSAPTNPKNLGRTGAEADKADAGLSKFYDEKLVNAANKIGKPHGVSVQDGQIPLGKDNLTGRREIQSQLRQDGISDEQWGQMSDAERNAKQAEWQQRGHKIFRMKVPQPLKDQALKKGFSLFEDTGPAAETAAAASHAQSAEAAPTSLSQPDWHSALSGDFKPTRDR